MASSSISKILYNLISIIKGQVYVDFVVELSSAATHQDSGGFQWVPFVDESSNQQGSDVGVILEGPIGLLIEGALRFAFDPADNSSVEESLRSSLPTPSTRLCYLQNHPQNLL